MKKFAPEISFAVGLGIISFIFLTVSLTSIAFIFHGTVSVVWILLSLVASVVAVYFLLAKQQVPKPWVWSLTLLVIVFGSVAFSSATIDYSWDGNAYHKTAIGELKNGWDPIWQNVNTFNKSAKNPIKLIGSDGLNRGTDAIWVNHYPKAAWVFAANIYKVTGNIESGKAISPLLIIAVFLIATSYFIRIFDRNKSMLLSGLLALNPIAVGQIYTYYDDGILGNLTIISILLLTMLIDKRTKSQRQRWLLMGVLAMTIVLLINIKFTGLAYAAIVVSCYYIFLVVKRNWQLVIHLTIVGIASVVFGVLIVGASSYVKNTYQEHNPFYPLIGKGKIDIITDYMPASYVHKPGVERFLLDNLDPVDNVDYNDSLQGSTPHPKIPFTINQSELSVLYYPDNREGGYGVWFGGILIASLIIGAYLIFRYGRKYKQYIAPILIPLISIGIVFLAFGREVWWARYLPQLCIVPIIIIAVLFLRKYKVLPYLLIFAMFFNVALTAAIGQSYESQFKQTADANIHAYVPCNTKTPTRVYATILDGALYNISDSCKNVIFMNGSQYNSTPQAKLSEVYEGIYAVHQ